MRLIDADMLKEELTSHFDIELEPVIEKEVLRMIDEQETISVASPKWISVKDKLPNCNGCYLVFRPHYYDEDHGAVTLCYFDGTDTWHDNDRVDFERILSPTDVTHWMPLPEPPEDGV